MSTKPITRKSGRVNSKKAAPPSEIAQTPLFELDSVGSSSVRHTLLHAATSSNPASGRLRRGTSFNKPLKSDQILSARSSVPALTGRVVPSAMVLVKKEKDRIGHIDRATKDRLLRIAGRDGKGTGLWAIKSGGDREEALTEAVRKAGEYDAWEKKKVVVKPGEDLGLKAVLIENTTKIAPKAPSTLHDHPLLKGGVGPRSIPLPHPGMSYNPSHPHHQALLSQALTHYTAVEEREERGQPIKDAMEDLRKATKGLEPWELYEEEVGSGEEEDEADLLADAEGLDAASKLKKKLPKRKTRQQRTKKLLLAAEALDLAQRRAQKARTASVVTAPAVNKAMDASIELSLLEKKAAAEVKRARLMERGLTRLRSGPNKVPDAPVTFQLGEELADNLRTLTPEGNLWREWVGSGMRRGKVPVERANESKKGGKKGGRGFDKGHKLKDVAKYSYKNFDRYDK